MTEAISVPTGRSVGRGRFAFMAALLLAAAGLAGWTAWHYFGRPSQGPNIAQDAREYLKKRQFAPLSGSLEKLLAESNEPLVRSQQHPLLGEPAPDFELRDTQGNPWKLSQHLADGPVIVVFYYGYHCNHCVGQLFALKEDVEKFRELGVHVVALSADAPELTRQRFRKYGEFGFPVLSDADNKIAQTYRVFSPAEGKKEAVLLHGTFVIDRAGTVQWVNIGEEPFTGNRTLLHQAAKIEGRLPPPRPQP